MALRQVLARCISTQSRGRVLTALPSMFRPYSTKVIDDPQFKLLYLDGDRKGIAVFAMTRPEAKNAFSRNMVNQMSAALETVKYDNQVRVVIIRSEAPGIFCAGADLKERIKMTPQEVSQFLGNLQRMVTDLCDLSVPTIAAMDGAALGGGMEMALACDIRVAASTAKLGLTETRLAIIPGGGGTQRLPRLVGPGLAKELIFTARVFDGDYAAKIGVVNHSVAQNDNSDAAYQKSLAIAEEILPNGPVAVKMAKQSINRGLETDLNTGVFIERACYAQVIPTKDRIEGLTAFKEKRPAKYTGQ